jgi:hypothetical protein
VLLLLLLMMQLLMLRHQVLNLHRQQVLKGLLQQVLKGLLQQELRGLVFGAASWSLHECAKGIFDASAAACRGSENAGVRLTAREAIDSGGHHNKSTDTKPEALGTPYG